MSEKVPLPFSRRRGRVLFLSDAAFEDFAGGSRLVAKMQAEMLARRGWDVTLLVPRQNESAPASICESFDATGGIVRTVRYLGAGRGHAFVAEGRAACARVIRTDGPFDLAHTHFAYAASGPLAVLPRNIPHVRTFHGPWDLEAWLEDEARLKNAALSPRAHALKNAANRAHRLLRARFERVNLNQSQAVMALSRYMADQTTRLGFPADRVEIIPGGADTTRFTIPTGGRESARRELGLPSNARILLSIRRLAPRMGLDTLIEALPRLVAKYPDTLLLIGGKGPHRESLEAAIKRLGMEQHARLVGFIPDDDLSRYYQAADLFVLPTLDLEGFGLVTVEALACGTPVVATPVGGSLEILEPLDRRLVARDTSADALTDAVLDFFSLNGSAANLAPEELRRFVLERYTWERHTDALEAVYERVLNARSAGTAL